MQAECFPCCTDACTGGSCVQSAEELGRRLSPFLCTPPLISTVYCTLPLPRGGMYWVLHPQRQRNFLYSEVRRLKTQGISLGRQENTIPRDIIFILLTVDVMEPIIFLDCVFKYHPCYQAISGNIKPVCTSITTIHNNLPHFQVYLRLA